MKLRFIGTEAEVRGIVALKRFGQAFELPDELVGTSILGSLPAIPEETFAEIGFTAEQLSKYADPGPRRQPDEDFAAKWLAARIALHEFRESLRGGE